MSYSESIELPDQKFQKGKASISRLVGIEQNITVAKLKNGNHAISMREGSKSLIFEIKADVREHLIELLK